MTLFSDSEGKISISATKRRGWGYAGMLTHAKMTGTTVMIATPTLNFRVANVRINLFRNAAALAAALPNISSFPPLKELRRTERASIYKRMSEDNYCGEQQLCLSGEAIC